jgi:hypothetical protein
LSHLVLVVAKVAAPTLLLANVVVVHELPRGREKSAHACSEVARRQISSIGGSAQARASSHEQHTPRQQARLSRCSAEQPGQNHGRRRKRHLLELVVWSRWVRHRPLQTDIAVHLVEILPQLWKPHRLPTSTPCEQVCTRFHVSL